MGGIPVWDYGVVILSDVGILSLAWLKFHRANDVKLDHAMCIISP
jgi:hypothetical protein